MARDGQDSLSLRRAAIWSLAIAAALVIPYYALSIYEFWYAAPGQTTALVSDPIETAEEKQEIALRFVTLVMPAMLAVVAVVLFSVLAPIFLLGQIVRRHLLLPLPPPRR
jgi:uncharacterized membrane protein